MQSLLSFIEIHRNELSERPIIEWLGWGFSEHYWTVQYQNAFGARWEGADLDTTVYRRPDDVDEKTIFD